MTNFVTRITFITLLVIISCSCALAQRVALKTNLAYWATTSPNLSAEFVFNSNVSLDLGVKVNPFDFKRFKTTCYLIQPEVRWWFGRPMAGHFVGVNAAMAQYSLRKDATRHKGDAFLAGISYGYVFVLGRRWNLETNIGVGWIRARDKKWSDGEPAPNAPNSVKDLFGPTRIGVTLSYIIK